MKRLALGALISLLAVGGCSRAADPGEDEEFDRDWVEDFENDTEEAEAQQLEQDEVDQYDDLDDLEGDEEEGATTPSALTKGTPKKRPAHGPLSIMEDDPHFSGFSGWDGGGNKIYDQAKSAARLEEARKLGVDMVRIMLWWKDVVPGGGTATTKPAGFVSSRPAQYDWRGLDMQIQQARAHGMKVLITVTAGPVPYWASEDPAYCVKLNNWACGWKPNVKEYAKFVTALGRHVKEQKFRIWGWTFVNEPNITAFLDDESPKKVGHRYRRLWFAARKHLRKTAGVKARVLFSDQANNTKSREPDAVRWRLFNYALCLKLEEDPEVIPGYCPLKSRKVQAHGIAFHPYAPGPQNAKASVDFLQQLTDDAAEAGRLPRNRGLYMTESAYLTARGEEAAALGGGFVVTPAQQAVYGNETDHLLSSNPRVKTLAQYEMIDEGRGTWDCGLRFAFASVTLTSGEVVTGDIVAFRVGVSVTVRPTGGAARELPWASIAQNAEGAKVIGVHGPGAEKPAYAAYRVAIDVTKKGDDVEVWGLAREDHGAGFTIEGLLPSGWMELQAVKTDALGFGKATLPIKGATAWRIRFATDLSREARL